MEIQTEKRKHKEKKFISLFLSLEVAYYVDKSSVSGDVNQVQAIERKSYRASWPTGYGNDAGGGDTVGLLK